MTKKIGIIGAGIVGSTTAYYLTKEKQDVTLFDDGLGQATSAAAGIISPWLSQRRNKEWYFLAKEGAKFYETLISDLSKHSETKTFYQKTGTLLYKKNQKLLDKLTALALERKREAPEIGDIKQLKKEEISDLIPNLSLEDDALFITGGAKIDGSSLTKALIDYVVNQSNTFISSKINHIHWQNNQWEVTDDNQAYYFDQLVLACGAWIGELLSPFDLHVDVRPQKGQLIELKTSLNTSNWPVIMPVGETDIIPFNKGSILIGATHENDMGFDLTHNDSLLSQLKHNGSLAITDLEESHIEHVRVGTRAYTSDFSPFFGEISSLPQLLVASGLGSSGLTTGPIIGKTLADWALNRQTNFENYRHKPNLYIYPN